MTLTIENIIGDKLTAFAPIRPKYLIALTKQVCIKKLLGVEAKCQILRMMR